MNIRAIIIEDEESSASILKHLLNVNCPDVEVLKTAQTVREGIKSINLLKPDLVFMDIDFPDGTGFDILNNIKTLPEIIFTTIHNDYALKAFEFAALHYLIKPIDELKLVEAVSRFSKDHKKNMIDEKLKLLKESLSEKPKKIMLPSIEGLNLYNLSEIVRCEADSSYTKIFFHDKTSVIISKGLNNLERILIDTDFIRIHSKHLINMKFIKKFTKGKKPYIELTTGEEFGISESRKLQFTDALSNFAKHI